MRFLFLLCFSILTFSLLAQSSDQASYRTMKVNGKVHTFKTSLNKDYPYEVSLIDIQGDTLSSSTAFAQNSKPTVLVFWTSTCVPCRYELTAIQKKYKAWQQEVDFNLYAISQDLPTNTNRFIAQTRARSWDFNAFHDYSRTFRRIMPDGVNGLPQTFLLDRNGKIVYHKKKYRMGDEDTLFNEIRSLKNSR
jgi:peroxiredoxin